MKPKTIGYVITKNGCLMVEVTGVLWMGREGTVFPDYGSARTAVRRSLSYARKRAFSWGGRGDFHIRRVAERMPRNLNAPRGRR